jgi:hypothetical protein
VDTKEVLIRAKSLIEDPKHWAQNYYAYSAEGTMTGVDSEDAVSWCALGATFKMTNGEADLASELLQAASVDLFSDGYDVISVNDELGHASVMQMYDKAIELADA